MLFDTSRDLVGIACLFDFCRLLLLISMLYLAINQPKFFAVIFFSEVYLSLIMVRDYRYLSFATLSLLSLCCIVITTLSFLSLSY